MRFRFPDFVRRPLDRVLISAAVLTLSGTPAVGSIVADFDLSPRACLPRADDHIDAVRKVRGIADRVIRESFPVLNRRTIVVKSFESHSTFLKTRFSIARYLTLRGTRIILSVNPCVFTLEAPASGIEAVVAHELAHAEDLLNASFFERVGHLSLLDARNLAKYERRMDLVAIERGYAAGLIDFRNWLYLNIDQAKVRKKRRNYFSPEEIRILEEIRLADPIGFKSLFRQIPLDLDAVREFQPNFRN